MAVIKIIIRVADVLSATIVSAASPTVLSTNTAGANEKIDDRLLLPPPWKGDAARVLARVGTKKEDNLSIVFFVPPQGLEPWTPTLRVSCSTN